MDVLAVERSFVLGRWLSTPYDNDKESVIGIAHSVVTGCPSVVLTSGRVKNLLRPLTENVTDHRYQQLENLFDFFSVDSSSDKSLDQGETEILRLSVAVACLQAFIQLNWTGPSLDLALADVLSISKEDDSPPSSSSSSSANLIAVLQNLALSELASGGEPAYHLADSPLYLRLAQLLLNHPFQKCQTIPWWKLRVALIHQQVLDVPVSYPDSLIPSLQPLFSLVSNDPELSGRLLTEQGLLHHQLGQDKNASELFIRAAKCTRLEYELTGALGKRTKFQTTELSQLVLLAESHLPAEPSDPQTKLGHPSSSPSPSPSSSTQNPRVPETLRLDDDTLLENTEFTSSSRPSSSSNPSDDSSSSPHDRLKNLDPGNQPPLHPLDQCILLGLCLNVRNTSPAHGLTTEQMTPYVNRIISHPINWSIHTMSLLLRTRLESHRTRTVERSILQLQALVDQMPTADSTFHERLVYFPTLLLPSKWDLEKELAGRFVLMGVMRSALEIYERLEMWEEVVKCYGSMEQHDKAISIVQDLLQGRKHEAEMILSRGKHLTTTHRGRLDTTRQGKLWCLLGDLQPEHALDHYTHAWEISNQSSGRAMRSLGGYHFARANYSEAIECLKKAVSINPILSHSWFILGCAYMRLEEWEDARNCFIRCVTIDEEDAESWNNLASMYLRLDAPVIKRSVQDIPVETDEPNEEEPTKSIPFSNRMMAFRALKRGLKYTSDNWRMWANYGVVSMDVGELYEACKALGRVADMTSSKGGSQAASNVVIDVDILERLVDAVTRTPAPAEEEEAEAEAEKEGEDNDEKSYLPSAHERAALRNPNEGYGLFIHVSKVLNTSILPRVSQISSSPSSSSPSSSSSPPSFSSSSSRVYKAHARLLTWKKDYEWSLKAYLNGYRMGVAGMMEKGQLDLGQWKEAVREVEEIVDVLRNFGPRVDDSATATAAGGAGAIKGDGDTKEKEKKSNWKLQARSLVRTFIAKSRDEFDGEEPEWTRLTEIVEELNPPRRGD